jgi:cephalosporin hydroxylase
MIVIDEENDKVVVTRENKTMEYNIGTPEAFREISKVYLRSGWDTKYVYSFSWLGRPIIQLPDDMIRIQEVIYEVQPDVILEVGVAHGGSLIYSASLCHAMGKGRVVGLDIEIRRHNRQAIEEHRMFDYITLIEGDSIANETISEVENLINDGETVLIFLDGCHTKKHVLKELQAYSRFVSKGSYIVAMDGIMKDLVGTPRSDSDWDWNNPADAALEFVKENRDFVLKDPKIPFNEGDITERTPTYWPNSFIKREK